MKFPDTFVVLYKGLLGYVLMIVFVLIFLPHENEFAIRLANNLVYFSVFCIGGSFMDLLSSIISFLSRRSEETQEVA